MQITNLILKRDDKKSDGSHKSPGKRGYMYEVYLGNELLCKAIDPEYTACRVLLERGITGRAQFWRKDKSHWDIGMNIEKAAKYCIKEGDKTMLHVGKYVPFAMNSEEEEAIAA